MYVSKYITHALEAEMFKYSKQVRFGVDGFGCCKILTRPKIFGSH